MKISWPKVAMLFIYVAGALVSLAIGSGGEAIAYMFAGAAANQGAYFGVYVNGNSYRSKRETKQ